MSAVNATNEVVVAATVRRREYAAAARPWRGQWLNMLNLGLWTGAFVSWFLWKLYPHRGNHAFLACVAGATLFWMLVWKVLNARRINQLFPEPDGAVQITTKLSPAGVSQTAGVDTTFVAWKNIKRIQETPGVLILYTPMSGCLYLFHHAADASQWGVSLRHLVEALRRGEPIPMPATDLPHVWPPPPAV